MCLDARSVDADTVAMDESEPIYTKVCVVCDRPALTLDQSGVAFCAEHAVAFIAADGTPVVVCVALSA